MIGTRLVNSKKKNPVASRTDFNGGVMRWPPFFFAWLFSYPCLCPLKVCCCAWVICTDKSSPLPCSFSFLLLSRTHPIILSLSLFLLPFIIRLLFPPIFIRHPLIPLCSQSLSVSPLLFLLLFLSLLPSLLF